MKLYGRVFSKANCDDINDHIELRRLEYEYYEHYGNIIYEDRRYYRKMELIKMYVSIGLK